MRYCGDCGAELKDNMKFCPRCGKRCDMVVQPEMSKDRLQNANQHQLSYYEWVCLVALILCIVLWLFAPFLAINRITLDEQPSALQVVIDDVTYFGERSSSSLFWATVVSLIGIFVGFLCVFIKRGVVLRITAIVTDVYLVYSVIVTWGFDRWRYTEDMGVVAEYIIRACGFGYWGILFLLLIVAVFAKNISRSA